MLFFLSFLALGLALGSSQQAELSQVLGRMENTMSTLNLRLARIEARQTRNMLIYSRLEGNIKDVKNDLDSKHGETMFWLRNTVTLLNDLKVKDDKLEAGQNIISENLQRIMNKTDECCGNDTIIVSCSSPTTISSSKSVNSSGTTTTVRPTTAVSTTQAPAGTTPTTSSPTTTATTTVPAPTDCKRVDQSGNVKDGVYKLELAGKRSIQVYCSAGYVTIQRRFNGAVSFDRTFLQFEQGFGEVSGESWLGLAYLYELTKPGTCSLRILLGLDTISPENRGSTRCGSTYASDCDGNRKEILVSNFGISPATDLYRIQVKLNSTTLLHPDVENGIRSMNGKQFTAMDKGPERSRCARPGNGGFWYDSTCDVGYPNTPKTSNNPRYCNTSNKVCAYWRPYYIATSWIQFRC